MKKTVQFRLTHYLLILMAIIIVSCSNGKNELLEFLDAKEAIYEDISVQMGTAYWNLYSDEAVADLETPKLRYAELFNNDTLNNLIDEWYNTRSKLRDTNLKRRVELWHNILTAAKINYSNDNLKIQNDLEIWLTEEDNAEGKPSQEELETMVIKLMRQRNEMARSMGYDNYGVLILEVTDIGYDWLIEFADTIEERTLGPYKKLLEDYKVSENISEINYIDAISLMRQYYANQIVPEVTSDSMEIVMSMILEGIGFNLGELPVRYIENEMPPGVGGQGIAVQIPNDFRIALLPGMDIQTWMHELGHGLQAMNTEILSPILKEYEWSFGSGCGGYAEGMAEISAKFALTTKWAKHLSSLSEDDIEAMINKANMYRPVYLRFWLNLFMYEIELYKDLDQDPDELKRQLAQKYLLLDNPPEKVRSIVDMTNVSYPFYIQNYTIAEVLSWQVHQTLEEKFGKDYALKPEVGNFLKEYFYKNGELLSWQDRLKKATGTELDLNGYLTYFGL
ncbi:MAG: M3 family metallopeptidase [Candidatus Marinimicrobia bacterium]|nr:M3 family metallopeptidase [Candidatus Neomarinimicrobiota bacterium]